MLRKQYCEHFGRPAKEPEMMFKLMFLKKLYDLSDERLISSAQTDMAFKYFLDLDPEAPMINPPFDKIQKDQNYRRYSGRNVKRNHTTGIKKGLIKSGTIIVDSTHTDAAVRAKSPTQILRD